MTTNEDGWRGFLDLCSSVKDPEQFNELSELFFTYEERHSLSTRYLIVKELMRDNKTQREIAQDLEVSISKITRGSNSLKSVGKKLRGLLHKIMM